MLHKLAKRYAYFPHSGFTAECGKERTDFFVFIFNRCPSPSRLIKLYKTALIMLSTIHSFHVILLCLRLPAAGLRVVLANCLTPLVNGYFTLATESHSDDGCPHCLEHLVFLGSEQYPYKGVLDALATRCLCNGTNAWTATDHTVRAACDIESNENISVFCTSLA